VASIEDYRIAPFHVLATEGRVWNDENHFWKGNPLKIREVRLPESNAA
jgi:hypothetical protein